MTIRALFAETLWSLVLPYADTMISVGKQPLDGDANAVSNWGYLVTVKNMVVSPVAGQSQRAMQIVDFVMTVHVDGTGMSVEYLMPSGINDVAYLKPPFRRD